MQKKLKDILGLTVIVVVTMIVVQYLNGKMIDWPQVIMVTVIFIISTTLGAYHQYKRYSKSDMK